MGSSKARPPPKGPAKATKAKTQGLPEKVFVVDNGAYTLKAGYAPSELPSNDEDILAACATIPNALAKTRDNRVYVGPQLNNITDWNETTFRRPVEKGYIVNWEAEKEIWEQSFFTEEKGSVASRSNKHTLRITDPEQTTLILTEAPNALPALQRNADEIVMEEWGFGGYYRCLGPTMNAWNDINSLFGYSSPQVIDGVLHPAECVLVVDSGYSHTTVTPVYRGRPLQRGIRRLDIGGKHLTNYLKEMVSMRQYNMVDETYIMNDVKEAVCFVSPSFTADMEQVWKNKGKRGHSDNSDGLVVDYVLPDPTARKKGFVRSHDPLVNTKKRKSLLSGSGVETISEDFLVLGNERFTVPEILFRPDDIGMKQTGIPELISQSLSVLPTGLHPAFLANTLVVGGNALIPGFIHRLQQDIQTQTSTYVPMQVLAAKDPILSTWLGASRFATNREELEKVAVTRQEYLEHGSVRIAKKFTGAGIG